MKSEATTENQYISYGLGSYDANAIRKHGSAEAFIKAEGNDPAFKTLTEEARTEAMTNLYNQAVSLTGGSEKGIIEDGKDGTGKTGTEGSGTKK